MFYRDAQKSTALPTAKQALPGRATPVALPSAHTVLGTTISDSLDKHFQTAIFGMGCFWGVERLFWQQEGVYCTAVGYSAGHTPNPTYEEVCSGLTAHNEVVYIVFDTHKIAYQKLLALFWENHNPCSYMQQANDRGSQYRSGIYTMNANQRELALQSKAHYQERLAAFGSQNQLIEKQHMEKQHSETEGCEITTEILPATQFYLAEGYHQQYLAKNPNGYCNAQTIEATGLPTY